MEKEETSSPSPDFIVGQTADNKSNLFDLNLSDYDLSDSDLCELEDSNSDLSDLDTDEPVNTSELDVDKFQKADLSNFKQYDSELEAR
uniref:Uncharacterized protein n=2 Tax=Nothobranchius TaxID=28779 RepID=A0A1A8QHX9_9TELE